MRSSVFLTSLHLPVWISRENRTLDQLQRRGQEGGGAPSGRTLLDRGDGFVDGLSDVVDVLGGQAAHVDAAAGHQVDVLLLDQVLHLLGWKTDAQ